MRALNMAAPRRVQFDNQMKFNEHISCIVNKAKKLNSALRMIRKKLKMDQFLKVMTSQFYGKCFYGAPVWLNGMNSFADLRKLNAMHYRSLRIARKDYKCNISRATLDRMGRARPSVWGQYLMASTAIKSITKCIPFNLHAEFKRNMFTERRKPLKPKFFDDSKRRIGRMAARNRLNFINDVEFDWINGMTDDLLRIKLKKHFKFDHGQ